MERQKQRRLEAIGFRVGDVPEFLGLSPEEARLVELRTAVSGAIRRLRQQRRMTQKQLALMLKSSQSRVARIEAGAADVSLDLLFRGLFAVGGGLTDLVVPIPAEVTAKTR